MNNIESNVRIYLKVYNELLIQWEAELSAMEPGNYLLETQKRTVRELKIKIKLLNELTNL